MHRRGIPAEAIRRAGYHSVWHGQKTWNGVATLSRRAEPILTRLLTALSRATRPGRRPSGPDSLLSTSEARIKDRLKPRPRFQTVSKNFETVSEHVWHTPLCPHQRMRP